MDRKITWATIIPLAGGFPIGAEQELGCTPEVVLSWDVFKSNDSHYVNYLKLKGVDNYISLDGEEVFEEYVDIVISTPPCAGLSALNTSKSGAMAKGSCAAQNQWMIRVSEYTLDKIKPKVLIFENAPGLYTGKDGKEVKDMLNGIAKKYGYSTSAVLTSTHLHGVPQYRKRTFFYFWKSEFAPFIEWSKDEDVAVSVEDYFSNISFSDSTPILKELTDDPYYQYMKHKFTDFRKEMTESGKKTMVQHIIKTGLFDDLYEFITKRPEWKTANKFVNHARNKMLDGKNFFDPSPNYFGPDRLNAIVGKSVLQTIHPFEDRYLSIKELLYAMGYPEDFDLLDPKRNYNHIAQNVPVCTGRFAVHQARLFVENKLTMSTVNFVEQNNIKKTIDTPSGASLEKLITLF